VNKKYEEDNKADGATYLIDEGTLARIEKMMDTKTLREDFLQLK